MPARVEAYDGIGRTSIITYDSNGDQLTTTLIGDHDLGKVTTTLLMRCAQQMICTPELVELMQFHANRPPADLMCRRPTVVSQHKRRHKGG